MKSGGTILWFVASRPPPSGRIWLPARRTERNESADGVLAPRKMSTKPDEVDNNLFHRFHGHLHEGRLFKTATQTGVTLVGELYERKRVFCGQGAAETHFYSTSTDTRSLRFHLPGEKMEGLRRYRKRGGRRPAERFWRIEGRREGILAPYPWEVRVTRESGWNPRNPQTRAKLSAWTSDHQHRSHHKPHQQRVPLRPLLSAVRMARAKQV